MTQTNKPPEWWLPEFNEKFGWLYLNVSKITGSPNWLYVSGDVKDFIKQTLLTQRAELRRKATTQLLEYTDNQGNKWLNREGVLKLLE